MTDQATQPTAAQRLAVGGLGRLFRGWSHDRTDAYLTVLVEWPADIISEAIQAVASEWRSQDAPPVARLVDECRDIAGDRRAAQRERVTSEGQGCPHCRREGTRSERVNGSDTLAYCPTHNTAWRGQITERSNSLGSQRLPDDIWLSKALNGDFGPLIQGVARRRQETSRQKPDAPQDAALTDVMKELAHG